MNFVKGNKEPLIPDLVERGKVTKQLLFKSDEVEVSLLELGINAKIKSHVHKDTREWYYNAETGRLESEVDAGGAHAFPNPTGRPLRVIAIKEFVN